MGLTQALNSLSTIELLLVTGFFATSVYTALVIRRYQTLLAKYGNLPGFWSIIGHADICYILPDIPYINRGFQREWTEKYSVFQRLGCDVVSFYSAWPWGVFSLIMADPAIIREMTANRAAYPKPVFYYDSLNIYGPNIVTTEGSEWKKHRKISAPAFTERNNILVHEETKKILFELFDLWRDNGQLGSDGVVKVQDMRKITTDLALQVIANAGFGYTVTWKDDEAAPAGHNMTFKKALDNTLHDLVYKIVFPRWLLNLFSRGRGVVASFDELESYMREMIQSRMESPDAERADLFNNLIQASLAEAREKSDLAMPDEAELIGNIYIFLLAGHETTARALAYTLALLALHQDIQQKVVEELERVVGPGQIPTYAHVSKLKYIEAVLMESLRQYPMVGGIPKYNEQDTVFTTTKVDGSTLAIPVPKNTSLIINIIALHYNPKYWPDPYTFNPDRFLQPYNKDAFVPFSSGARSCIGRRFSEVEAITAIAIIVSQFQISISEGAKFVVPNDIGKPSIDSIMELITMTPTELPLTLTRRKS